MGIHVWEIHQPNRFLKVTAAPVELQGTYLHLIRKEIQILMQTKYNQMILLGLHASVTWRHYKWNSIKKTHPQS